MSDVGGGPSGGWHPDPFGRHEHRYWDGTAWTDQVSDAGQAGTDPPAPAAAVGAVSATPYVPPSGSTSGSGKGKIVGLVLGGLAVVAVVVVLALVVLGGDDGDDTDANASGGADTSQDGSSDSVTVEEWTAESGDLCLEWDAATSPLQLPSQANEAAGLLATFHDDLVDLDNPEEIDDDVDELLDLIRDRYDILAGIDDAVDAGENTDALVQDSLDNGQEIVSAFNDLNVECGFRE